MQTVQRHDITFKSVKMMQLADCSYHRLRNGLRTRTRTNAFLRLFNFSFFIHPLRHAAAIRHRFWNLGHFFLFHRNSILIFLFFVSFPFNRNLAISHAMLCNAKYVIMRNSTTTSLRLRMSRDTPLPKKLSESFIWRLFMILCSFFFGGGGNMRRSTNGLSFFWWILQ